MDRRLFILPKLSNLSNPPAKPRVTVGAIEDLDLALDQSIAAYVYLFRYTSEVSFISYQICTASNQRLQMED